MFTRDLVVRVMGESQDPCWDWGCGGRGWSGRKTGPRARQRSQGRPADVHLRLSPAALSAQAATPSPRSRDRVSAGASPAPRSSARPSSCGDCTQALPLTSPLGCLAPESTFRLILRSLVKTPSCGGGRPEGARTVGGSRGHEPVAVSVPRTRGSCAGLSLTVR